MVATKSGESGLGIQEDQGVESFDLWYAREHPRLIATLLLTTGNMDLATEGVDEACALALEKWDRVSSMSSPAGWTFKVAINHARRMARRRTMERRLLFRRTPDPPVPAPAGEIWHIVSDLPLRQRQVVVLRHVADLPEAAIAETLGVSRSTVSSTLSDAHHHLGHLLDDPTPPKEITHE
jgi:DNA-directed RNA polymerase specialized sigma24 family protein